MELFSIQLTYQFRQVRSNHNKLDLLYHVLLFVHSSLIGLVYKLFIFCRQTVSITFFRALLDIRMTQFFLEFCCCMIISKKWMELVFRVEIGAVSLRLELLCYKNNFQGRNIHRIEIFSTVFSALAGRQRTNSHSDIVFTAHNGIYFIRTEQEMFIFLFTLLLWLLFNFRLFRFFSLDIFHVS